MALVLAATRPDLVRALVLIAPAGLGQGVDSEFLAHLPELAAPEEAEALLHRLVSRPRLIGKPMVTGLLRHLAGGDRRAALRRVAAILAEDQASVRDAVAQVALSALPRLVIWGAADRINRPDEAALQDFGGQLEIVPDAGHLPQVESATLVNNTILGFLVA